MATDRNGFQPLFMFSEPAAGAPSLRPGSPRPSPAARPSEINFSRPASPGPDNIASRTSPGRLGSLLGRGPTPRERSGEHAHDKQECQYALRSFGVQPDIDFTFKRHAGEFAPGQGSRPRNGGHGSRSAFSDQCEALKALSTFGVCPSVEVIDRRARGSCSPINEGYTTNARGEPFRRNQYLHDCNRLGLHDITEIRRLGVGDCSPRLDPDAGILATVATRDVSRRTCPSNLMSTEARLARDFRRCRSQQALLEPDLFPLPESPHYRARTADARAASPLIQCRSVSPPAASLALEPEDPSARIFAALQSSVEQQDAGDNSEEANADEQIVQRKSASSTGKQNATPKVPGPTLMAPTFSSRARNARNLTEIKLEIHSKLCAASSPTTATPTPKEVRSPASTASTETASQCTHSYRLAHSQRSLSMWTSSTSSSRAAQSHRSFKLAGDILAELKDRSLPVSKTVRQGVSDTAWLPQEAAYPTKLEGPKPKLAGNILSELKAELKTPLRCSVTHD